MNLHKFDILTAKYFSEGLSAEEQLLLDDAIEKDLFYFDRFEQMKNAWNNADSYNLFKETEKNVNSDFNLVWDRIIANKSKYYFISSHFKISNVAAAVAFIFLMTASVFLYQNVAGFGKWKAYSTNESVETIWLPDSTCVTLNEYSRVVFLKNPKNERRVRIKGEAFFDVAHNVNKPFVIDAGKVEVQVLGTKFDLKADLNNDYSEVYVTDGVVAFKAKVGELILEKGEKGTFNNGVLSKQSSFDLNNLYWKSGVLIFSNSSLEYVAKSLKINFDSIKEVKSKYTPTETQITTKFENQSLDEILKEFELHFNKKFEIKNNILIISD